MDENARRETIEFLRLLSDEDLAALFYEAMKTRNQHREQDDGDFWNDVYVISIASHARGEPAETLALATAHESSYPLTEETKRIGPTLQGQCEVCKTWVTSTSKSGKCPVCSTEVGCT